MVKGDLAFCPCELTYATRYVFSEQPELFHPVTMEPFHRRLSLHTSVFFVPELKSLYRRVYR